MELPKLPREFSDQARSNVVRAHVLAHRAVAEAGPQLRRFAPFTQPCGNQQILQMYVLPVLLAFAKEACAIGRRHVRGWSSDRTEREVLEFRRQLVAGSAYSYDRPGYRVHRMLDDWGEIIPEVTRIIEASPEWKAYRELLLDAVMASVDEPARSAVPKLKKKKPIRRNARYDRIAAALKQISKSQPHTQEEIFRTLDQRRAPVPLAEPFRSARAWVAGFGRNRVAARAWLSKWWSQLDLPPLARGPKNEK